MENKVETEISRWKSLKSFLREKFNLDEDKATEDEVVENITKGVEFHGTNLWVLIFATFVASIGLNVNSTAVIIGAMLISPLMGPIMGIGLSIGINDFSLMKQSLKNFGFMVLVSILTSTLYFMISPLSNAQSELLARTTPTAWDVLIAFFGGLAGIVAQSRKDRTSTVIPGVAIATALMPPLCTAGFGLATGQFSYFFGAAYLFFINTVFIALATFVIVRFIKYEKKVFLDKRRERTVRRYMAIIVIVTLIPSVLLGYRIVERTIFETNVDRYVSNVLKFENTQVLGHTRTYSPKGSVIEVVLIGDVISDDAIANVKAQLPNYGLNNTDLQLRNATNAGVAGVNISSISTNMEQLLKDKNERISRLESVVQRYARDTVPAIDISREMSALTNSNVNVAVSRSVVYNHAGKSLDTILMCLITYPNGAKQIDDKEKERIENWLKARTNAKKIQLFIE